MNDQSHISISTTWSVFIYIRMLIKTSDSDDADDYIHFSVFLTNRNKNKADETTKF